MTLNDLDGFLRKNRLPHASVITGGTAETRMSAAMLVARAAVCSGETPLCGACRDCRKAERGLHPDITVIERASDEKEYSVARLRAVRTAAFVIPNEASRAATVITDADAMNEPAQNAMLNILEEPPEHAVFILLCENPELLLPTVRSRLHVIRLSQERADGPEEICEAARSFIDAVISDGERPLLDAVLPIEKMQRAELAEFIQDVRRETVRRAGELDGRSLEAVIEALRLAESYQAVNVSAGHIAGLLLAKLIIRREQH